ncbi:MAG: hypothetical protein KAY24_08170 [Candidatus Eisenbacteria sp.]|nr:hypothetical protein [Candidatus Eisenbacteria bacterium]
MLREVHEHVVSELQQSARTDTVFVVTAVLFNLIVMGINWGVASESGDSGHPLQNDCILGILIIATILINSFAVRALLAGRDTRNKLISGLVAMYRDNDVDKYYDASLLDTYGTRYMLFLAVLVSLAAISIIVPLLARLLG